MALIELNIRHYIIIILYFSYIYDAIRREYIESRFMRLKKLERDVASRGDAKGQKKQGLHLDRSSFQASISISSSSSTSSSSSSSAASTLSQAAAGKEKADKSFLCLLRRKLKNWMAKSNSKQGTVAPDKSAAGTDQEARHSPSPSPQSSKGDGDKAAAAESAAPTASALSSTTNESKAKLDDKLLLKSLEQECPLKEMPKFYKFYKYFSSIYIFYSFIRYACISLIRYQLINVDPIYECYFPGRLSFMFDLAHELPAISFIIILYHVIYRFIWFFHSNRLELDCFVFAVCSEELVREKEVKLDELANNSVEAKKASIRGSLFYQYVSLFDHKPEYRLKNHRTLEHWRKLKRFIEIISMVCVTNFAILALPISAIIVYQLLSHEFFALNYKACQSFATTQPTSEVSGAAGNEPHAQWSWSFKDQYRLAYFFFDFVDNFILLVDTSCAMTWPFTAAVIATQDLTLRLESLCERMAALQGRLVENNWRLDELQLPKMDSELAAETTTTPTIADQAHKHKQLYLAARIERKLSEASIYYEIRVILNEIFDTFKQIGRVNKFMSKFAAFCIFCWFVVNLFYQLISISRKRLIYANYVAQFLQVFGLTALTFTFAYLSRTYNLGIRLYHRICCLMAHDRHLTTTRNSWARILEYYHEHGNMFALHLGGHHALSMQNYIKSMLFFISCALVVINLFRIIHLGGASYYDATNPLVQANSSGRTSGYSMTRFIGEQGALHV